MSSSPPTDLLLAEVMLGLYQYSVGYPRVTFDKIFDVSGVYAGLKHLDGDQDILAFRGSVTLPDWIHDFEADSRPVVDHPQMGKVDSGFFFGVEAAMLQIIPELHNPLYIVGHSLGGPRATYAAALLTLSGKVPLKAVMFESPRPGMQQLVDILAKVPGTQFRNVYRGDHSGVTDLPFHFPLLFPYVHPWMPFIELQVVPDPGDDHPISRLHHMWLCYNSLKIASMAITGA